MVNSYQSGLAVGPTEVHKIVFVREVRSPIKPIDEKFPIYLKSNERSRALDMHYDALG